ncbi:MAG: TetR/AcrR family transcriptional regulator [Aquabacterium sp.]
MNAPLESLSVNVAPRPYGGVSAAERQAQRRERLIEAAYDVFGRDGHRNTTMRLICAQARLTERYFYEHFSNVDEVFLAVHKRLSAEVSAEIMTRVMAAGDDPVAQTRAGLTAFFEFIKADPRRAQILLLDAVATGLTNPRNLNAKVSQYAEFLKSRFKKRYPNLNVPLDVELVVGGFVGMIIHTASVWAERQFDTPLEVLVDHNAYAWLGLHQWLTQHDKSPEAAAMAT